VDVAAHEEDPHHCIAFAIAFAVSNYSLKWQEQSSQHDVVYRVRSSWRGELIFLILLGTRSNSSIYVIMAEIAQMLLIETSA
jgi:hypothetical protein